MDIAFQKKHFRMIAILSIALPQVISFITRADYFYRTDRPLLIAHRGFWGKYPEHAVPGYVEAYYAGVDFIEFDVQVTKDKQLVLMHDPVLNFNTDIWDHTGRFGDRIRHLDRFYIPEFTLAELRTIFLKQRYLKRGKRNNKKWVVQTFQEVIDLIRMLNKEFPRTKNAERKIGLYIELKDWQWNIDWGGANSADLVYETLVKNGLDTIEKCKDDIPIVIQSFDLPALEYFSTLTELPFTYVMGVERSTMWQRAYYFIEESLRL